MCIYVPSVIWQHTHPAMVLTLYISTFMFTPWQRTHRCKYGNVCSLCLITIRGVMGLPAKLKMVAQLWWEMQSAAYPPLPWFWNSAAATVTWHPDRGNIYEDVALFGHSVLLLSAELWGCMSSFVWLLNSGKCNQQHTHTVIKLRIRRMPHVNLCVLGQDVKSQVLQQSFRAMTGSGMLLIALARIEPPSSAEHAGS